MADPQTFSIRFSNVDDLENIMAFYAKYPHKNVAGRHENLIRELADSGSIIMVENKDTGEIVGLSISYPIMAHDGGVDQEKWLEVGTTRMVLNGYAGLFNVMIGMQVLRAYLVEPPEERFVCQMESPFVRAMAHELGFRPFVPSKELVELSDKTLDIADGETYGYENWYSAGPEALPVLAQKMIEAMDKPCLENPKTHETIQLDFSKTKFFDMFEKEIRSLAGKSYGNPDTPDMEKSVAKHRQEWMRSFFK